MSTFSGRIAELPSVSVDRFDGVNQQSGAFFLSHCHTDHMVGLGDLLAASSSTSAKQRPIHLSAVSAVIVRGLHPDARLNLVPLAVGEPTVVQTDDTHRLTVTALPAGHCPGSVMFLFETEGGIRILYTGDIRLNGEQLRRMSTFRSTPLPAIHAAYIDTTFLSQRYRHFPSLRRSGDCTLNLCTDWLQQHRDNYVQLQLSARFGYEYLFQRLRDGLGQPVHVNDADRSAMYRYLPELDGCVVAGGGGAAEAARTRLHACYDGTTSRRTTTTARRRLKGNNTRSKAEEVVLPCGVIVPDERRLLTIRLSAMAWNDWHEDGELYREVEPRMYRVCYSTHSSWTEIREILSVLRPERVVANVEPAEAASRERMRQDLHAMLGQWKEMKAEDDGGGDANAAAGNNGSVGVVLSELKFRVLEEIDIDAEDDGDDAANVRQASIPLPKRRKHDT